MEPSRYFQPNRYLVGLGGVSALIAAAFFLGTIVFTLVVLAPTGYLDIMEDQSLIPDWVSHYQSEYAWLWLLFFLSQFFLLPVPFAVEENFRIEGRAEASWLRMGAMLGVVSIVMTMLSITIYYAASPIIADSWDRAGGDPERQYQVIQLNDVIASIGTMTRVFSEFLLGIWLLVTAYVLADNPLSQLTRWIVFLAALLTLLTTGVKIFDRATPLELITPFAMAGAWTLLGIALLRDSRRIYPSVPTMSPEALEYVMAQMRKEER